MDQQCYFCHTRSFQRLLDFFQLSDDQRQYLTRNFFNYLATIDEHITAPEVTRDVHEKFRELLKQEDLYSREKRNSNMKMLAMYPRLKKEVLNSNDPFNTALRLCIGGNIIDVGPSLAYNIDHTISRVIKSPLAIDHSQKLKKAIQHASRILYLGDNTGEIVMDRLFLETINHPDVTFAVRGKPILNDATMDDANLTGLAHVARIISNGDDAPSTLLHRTSKEFNEVYERADLVIAKGMGNLEGLLHTRKSGLFFMLIAKCDHISNILGVSIGDFIIMEHTFAREL